MEEKKEAKVLTTVFESYLTKNQQYSRAVHARTFGMLKGEFKVLNNPDDLKVGVFAKQQTYNCNVRFSSSFADEFGSDLSGSPTGISIELIDPLNNEPLGQNFLLSSSETFPFNIDDFVELIASYNNKCRFFSWVVKMIVNGKARQLYNAYYSYHQTVSLLYTEYFSIVPFKFGENKVVKYHLRTNLVRMPADVERGSHYLTNEMNRTLKDNGYARFEFCLQFKEKDESIDDVTVAWSGSSVVVAELVFKSQDFATRSIMEAAKNKEIHNTCLPEHAPLGKMNRVRHYLYRWLSDFKHQDLKF